MVYRGSGVNAARAARVNGRTKRKKVKIETSALVKLLSLAVLFTIACTMLIINAAGSIETRNRLSSAYKYQSSVINRINSVNFEIQREIRPDNLSLLAESRLGMVWADGNSDSSVIAAK